VGLKQSSHSAPQMLCTMYRPIHLAVHQACAMQICYFRCEFREHRPFSKKPVTETLLYAHS